MNRSGAVLWGFVGTIILTGLMAASQGLGLTRMSLPFMLGTMFTSNRDRAKLVGFGVHLLNGWLFAFFYAAAFESWRRATELNPGHELARANLEMLGAAS